MKTTAKDCEEALKTLRDLPAHIDAWEVETGEDWTNDPSVWIMGYLRDGLIDIATQMTLRKAIKNQILKCTNDDINIYISFRLTSEMEQST